jgi:hypothetical protein
MNATGSSDMTQWYDRQEGHRNRSLKPRIEKGLRMISGEDVHIEFAPMERLNVAKATEVRERRANADRTYVDLPQKPEGMELVLARIEDGSLGIPQTAEDVKTKKELLEKMRDEKLNPPEVGVDPLTGLPLGGPPGAPGGAVPPTTPQGKPPTAGAKPGDPGGRKGPTTGRAT